MLRCDEVKAYNLTFNQSNKLKAWHTEESSKFTVSGSSSNGDIDCKSTDLLDNYLISIGSRSSRFRRKQKEKIVIGVLLLLILILLIILITIGHYYAVERNKNICESKECVRSAANIILSMDTSIDPCDDFYTYVCGNWAEQHPKPDFSLSYDWFSDKQKNVERKVRDVLAKNITTDDPKSVVKAKDMYKACVDSDTMDSLGMKTVMEFMTRVGLPLIPTFFNITKRKNSTFDWLKTETKIKLEVENDVFIGFEIYPDLKNATIKRLVFGEPSLTDLLPGYKDIDKILNKIKKERYGRNKKSKKNEDDIDDEKDSEEYKESIAAYKSMYKLAIKEVLKYAKSELNDTLKKEDIDLNIDKSLDEYINFTESLTSYTDDDGYNLTTSTESLEEDDILYYTIREFQNLTDQSFLALNLTAFPLWKPYLVELFNNSNVKLDYDNEIIMTTQYDIEVLIIILSMVRNTSRSKLEMYMWLQVLENFIPHTTKEIREAYTNYVMKITGIEGSVPRSVYCASTVTSMMGMAVGYSIIDKNQSISTLSNVKKMLKDIKDGFEQMLLSVNWMDLPTKRATVEKVRTMKELVGFPDWLLEPDKLEKLYENISIDPKKHLENQINVVRSNFKSKLDEYEEPYIFDWDTVPTEVNAYHTFQANGITIPLVMLQYPFYDLGLEALNYGSIGTILGHEITHGFDDQGRQYDKDGSITQWWSNTTSELYVNKTNCLIDQYSNFYVSEVDKHVDGKLTLGENIADNGGLKAALLAYWMVKEKPKALPGLPNMQGDKLFFLSYANLWCGTSSQKSLKYDIKDEHSPSHLRLKGTLQNLPEFARAWKCPVNSTMNPSKTRCTLF